MTFFVYILASKRNGTLYIGMTDDLSALGLVRTARIPRVSVHSGAPNEKVESRLEDQPDPKDESGVARSVFGDTVLEKVDPRFRGEERRRQGLLDIVGD